MKKTLTPKAERFCKEYVVDFNGTHAAIKAGYSEKTADRIASQLLGKLDVQDYIKELQAKAEQKIEITKEEILNDLRIIKEAKIEDYCHWDGEVLKFKPSSEWTPEMSKAVESIKMGKFGLELKLHGKSWSIERLCKMLGYDMPKKVEVTTDEEIRIGYKKPGDE